MKNWMRATVLACAVQVALAPGAYAQAPASPERPPVRPAGNESEGRTRFGRGIELYKEGNFHAALAEFRAAYAAAPSWRIQYNLGQTLYQLQDYAGALAAFQVYVTEGADKIEPARRTEVDGEIAKLVQRVATVTLILAPPAADQTPTAEILIDDEAKGSATGKLEVVVSAGRRKFTASAPGYRTSTRVIDVAGSTRVELQLPLEPLVVAPAVVAKPRETAPPPPAPRSKSRLPFWLGLGATGLAAGGTITFALLAKREHDKFQNELGIPNIAAESLQSTRDATKQNALAADILGGATIALATFTVVALILTSGHESPPKQAAKVQPLLGPGAVGLHGSF